MRQKTDVWLKALIWLSVGEPPSSRLSYRAAWQARPCGLQPANCSEKLAAV
jgi:hypothetical protein